MGNYAKTLLIGCGGSGIKTLIRLNKLLSSNPNYRHDVRESISYLVIDTDRKELNGFVSKIESQMGEAGLPNIATAHISEGFSTSLNPIIRETFDKYKDDAAALEKLKKHWMFNPDGEPFRGIRIRQVEAGAGQCCQVSYLTTWNYMPKLEETLGNLINEMRKRDPGETKVQVFLVAGLAGGTGRGSWQLVAFKVRQALEEEGIAADITAVFFDSSCYPNVPNSKQERENLLVNSYTAMSELAGWMRLKKARKYFYSLPYLDNPDSEVIKVYDDGDPNRQSPVLQAFLIFGSNGRTGRLENNKQYHNMAATALYSMVVYPDVINAITVNRRMNIGSFAATTFEVDTYHLRSFFETAVQKKFVEKQCAELTASDLADQVEQVLGGDDPKKGTFLGDNCLWLPESLSATSSDVSLEFRDEDKILSLLQKIYKEKIKGIHVTRKRLVKDGPEVFGMTDALAKELAKQNDPAKGLNQWIDSKLQLVDVDDETLASDLDAVLAEHHMNNADLVKTLDKTVLDQFAPEDKDVSLGRCILFTAKLKACFEKYLEALNQGISLQGVNDPCKDIAEDVAKNLKALVAKAYTEDNGLLGLGKKFNEKEIESICSQFQYCMYAAIFLKLRPALIDFYTRAVKHLEVIADALDNMVKVLKKTNSELDKNFETDFGKLSYDEIIGQYFITDVKDQDSVMKSIPMAASLKNVYYRQLKPIMPVDEINALLSDDKTVRINKRPVLAEIGKQLQHLLAVNDTTVKNKRFDSFDEALKTLPKELCKLIAANVHLADKVGNETFMDAHFSFKEVLDKNIKCWNMLLQESSSTQQANLKDRFRDFLGVDDRDYDEDGLLIKDNVLTKIIFSLVASCKPWVQVVANSKLMESLDCTILLPQTIDNPAELAVSISKIYNSANMSMSANIQCPGVNENALNLPSDRIVVFNAEILQDNDFAPMDKIQNLTDWSKDSAVNSLLVLAEAPREGETAWFQFEDGQWVEKPRGIAYVSPIFEDEELPFKDNRWHPWVKETPVSMEEAQLTKAHKALFYAFLGNGDIPADANV